MAFMEEDTPGSDVLAGYDKATKISPISESSKKEVLDRYGIKVGWAKGKTDAAITGEAAKKVVAKFKADKAKIKPKPATTSKPKTPYKSGTTGGPVTSAVLSKRLAAAGFTGSKPPAYALKNVATLDAWILRASRLQVNQQLPAKLAAAGFPNAKPPAYALISMKALDAWILRAKQQAANQRIQQAASYAVR